MNQTNFYGGINVPVIKTESILVNGGYMFTMMPKNSFYPNGSIQVRNDKGEHVLTISPSDLKDISDHFSNKN
jgi:hypothetical protein